MKPVYLLVKERILHTSMTLPGDVQLCIQRTALTLTPAADGARLQLSMQVWTNMAPPLPLEGLAVSAPLYVTAPPNYKPRYQLCELTTEDLFNPTTAPTTVNLIGHVSDHALRVVEQMRAGGPLHLVFGLSHARLVAGDPPAQRQAAASEFSFELYADEWASQLVKVTAASYLHLMIPITDDPDLQVATARVRKAHEYIGDGKFDAVAGELRQVLELVRAEYETRRDAKTARDKLALDGQAYKKWTKEERWALVVEDRFSWLSAFEHDDDEAIKGIAMDRAEALDALYEVAGKLQRLAHDRRAGRI